jgi:hypothetical protein
LESALDKFVRRFVLRPFLLMTPLTLGLGLAACGRPAGVEGDTQTVSTDMAATPQSSDGPFIVATPLPTDVPSSEAPTASLLPTLGGRLIFEQTKAYGRHIVHELDAATGERRDLFVVSEDHDTLVRDFTLAPQRDRLAYALSGPQDATRIVVRALDVDSEPAVVHELAEHQWLAGLHWRPDGGSLIAGVWTWQESEPDLLPLPEAFEIWTIPVGPTEVKDGESPQRLYRDGAIEDYVVLGAWDEPSAHAALLYGGDGAYVRTIRVVDAASGEVRAEWPTGGEGYRYAVGPNAGNPEARRLAVVDEAEMLADRDAPAHVRLIDLGQSRWQAIAQVPAGVRAADLTWSDDGGWLAWSETPYRTTGVQQRMRFVRLGEEVGPAMDLPVGDDRGAWSAIPLAFEPAGLALARSAVLGDGYGLWLLAGDGLHAVGRGESDEDGGGRDRGGGDASAGDAAVAFPSRLDIPWMVEPPAEDVYPRHALSKLGEVIGWVDVPINR